MSDAAIRVDHVSKRYYRGATSSGGTMLAEQIAHAARSLVRRTSNPGSAPTSEAFWALRDVSLSVEPGEVVGLIGPNGAGKSTLLRLLARITPPTDGRIELRGRMAALLEVGTGFHPELTGRENVFLNGAILGLSRREIERRYDAIVEFSGVEAFLDTPVKRYSSGMFVRLGFAVAAHLDAEILLIDEVLAVGDAAFQRKCLNKMRDLTLEEGRTIVFVSHNLPWVERLCNRVFLIDNGQVADQGPVSKVIAGYLSAVDPIQHGGATTIPAEVSRIGTGTARFLSARLLHSPDGEPTGSLLLGQPLVVETMLRVDEAIEEAVLEIGITSIDGQRVITALSTDRGQPAQRLEPGLHRLHVELEPDLLPGEFVIDLGVHERVTGGAVDLVERVLQFAVGISDGEGETYAGTVRGFLRAATRWDVQRADAVAARQLP